MASSLFLLGFYTTLFSITLFFHFFRFIYLFVMYFSQKVFTTENNYTKSKRERVSVRVRERDRDEKGA